MQALKWNNKAVAKQVLAISELSKMLYQSIQGSLLTKTKTKSKTKTKTKSKNKTKNKTRPRTRPCYMGVGIQVFFQGGWPLKVWDAHLASTKKSGCPSCSNKPTTP